MTVKGYSLKQNIRPSQRKLSEGLNFSDYFDDSIPAEVKPPNMLRPMEEMDYPIQAKNLFKGLWEGENIFINDMTPQRKDEFKSLLVLLFKYLQKELNLKSLPKIVLLYDDKNSNNILGKTGYYNPSENKIALYVFGRHPKDILRSFAHEVIHFWQHVNGNLENNESQSSSHDPKYAQNNPHLRKMEKQAYLLGNMMFRDWEDNKKSEDKKRKKELSKSLYFQKKLNEAPEELFNHWYDSNLSMGPFILFDKQSLFGNRKDKTIYHDGSPITTAETPDDVETHSDLEIAYKELSTSKKKFSYNYDKFIYGRIWRIKQKVYVATWNSINQIKSIGLDVFLSGLNQILKQHLNTNVNDVYYNPYNYDNGDNILTLDELKKSTGSKRDTIKQKEKSDLHIMDPSLKGKALKQMGVKPKVIDIPDFKRRQLVGVDEETL